jgi:protein-S-isoprenylcysteine O-methyltransferase Ste14
MTERILIILLPLIFLGTFIIRNSIVKAHTKQSIRAFDPLVKATMILTNLCIFMALISTYSESWYKLMGPIIYLRFPIISYVGFSLFGISIIMGWLFSAQLKESWRIGVPKNQKIELIQDGIYAYVRNPYFFSYFVMFFSLFLVRLSLIMIMLVVATITVFHLMVLKEEAYLLSIHGKKYEKYKNTTGRYIPRFIKEITSDNS